MRRPKRQAINDEYINFIYDEIYRVIHDTVSSQLGRQNLRILEIGAGSLSKSSNYFANVTLSDGSDTTKFGKEHLILAEKLPFESEMFDAVIAKDTLHHFQNVQEALAQIHRVLKKDGVFVVSEPYWSLLGRFVFKFIHPERWNTRPHELLNYSSNPFDANQATLLCLTKSKFKSLVQQNKFFLDVIRPTYGLSYLISGGLNYRSRVNYGALKKIHELEINCPWILKVITGLNTIAIFSKYEYIHKKI